MRLLKLDRNSESVLSTIFVGDDVPSYAILSHTWGPDTEEFSFKDLTRGTGMDKVGYDKIKFCGERAKHDNLQYFWADTCCIDKSDSVELQEAINSMFRWYQNAAKCYVYLADVSCPPSDAKIELCPIPWETAFCKSRWFSRGWTLQELLAPTCVEFFSREGTLLGDKRSLERQIHNATKIPLKALRGCPLPQFTVDERLQWAQFRETTRGEDWAYSLLGILEIFMPLIYGEGRVNAVTRLYAEISEASRRLQMLPKNLPYIKDAPLSMINTEDKVYKAVLDRVILLHPGHESMLKGLLGSVVILQTPLPARSLCRLIQLPEAEFLHLLDGLHAVLYVPDDLAEPLRVHDVSFRTFMSDERRCGNPSLLVEPKQMHRTLAANCLKIMSKLLKQDVFGGEYAGTLSASAAGSQLERFLPLEVQYACINWVHHLQKGHTWITVDSTAISFLKVQLLHWLEAMGWMQRITEAIDMIVSLKSMVHASVCNNLDCSKDCSYLGGVERFTLYFQEGIVQDPLQIYYSTTVFAPAVSPVRTQIENGVPRWMQKLPKVDKHWRSPLAFTHGSRVVAVGFVPGGNQLVSASEGGTIRVWDIHTGRILSQRELSSRIDVAKFSGDCKLLASVGDRKLTLWDILSGKEIYVLEGRGQTPYSPVFSPDGKRLAWPTGYRLILCDSEKGSCLKSYEYDVCFVHYAAFSRDGRQLAFFSNFGVHVWDTTSEKKPKELRKSPLQPSETFRSFVTAAFFPDGKQLIAFCRQYYQSYCTNTVAIWNTESGQLIKKLKNPAYLQDPAAFSPDCTLLAFFGSSCGATLWNLESGDMERLSMPEGAFRQHKGQQQEFMHFSPDHKQLAACSHDTVIVWSIRVRNEHETFLGHGNAVTAIELSPNGRQLASASNDMMIKLWDPYSGKETKRLSGHEGSITAMTFSADGIDLVTASADDTIRFWNTISGEEVAKLSRYGRSINNIAFSPNGIQLLWASPKGGVWLCEISWLKNQNYGVRGILRLNKKPKEVKGVTSPVTTVAFSVDGEQQAFGSEDGIVRLRSTASKKFTLLKVHGAWISAVAFLPDGKQLAVASSDKAVTLWDIMSGLQLQKITLLAPLSSLRFSSDGQSMETDRGTLSLSDFFSSSHQSGQKPPGNIFLAGEWIYRGVQRLLWLPREYRGRCWVVRGNLVVIGQEFGAVTFLEFRNEVAN